MNCAFRDSGYFVKSPNIIGYCFANRSSIVFFKSNAGIFPLIGCGARSRTRTGTDFKSESPFARQYHVEDNEANSEGFYGWRVRFGAIGFW